jgi:signal transduction histidine kinase
MIGRHRDPMVRLSAVVQRLTAGDLTASADEADGPADVRALAAAINQLGDKVRREAAAELDAEHFRQHTRLISSTIRRATNVDQMADYLVRAVGQAFEVDRVWLHTFVDDRIPRFTVQWSREHLSPIPQSLEAQAESTRFLADTLWDGGTVLALDRHRGNEKALEGLSWFANAETAGATASIVAPIGDSGGAFGLLWLSMAAHGRRWTLLERGVAQHLATDLAHSLVQAHVIGQQAHAVTLLRELDQAKADFISTVSHELRTPLTSIAGYLEMLLDGDAGDLGPEAHTMLRIIDRNAVRLRNLIEDLLTQSRIDAGRLRLEVTKLDPGAVLDAVRTALLPLAGSAGITLNPVAYRQNSADERGQISIEADPHQLDQVFTNLVTNAIKFSEPGSSVDIEYGPDDEGEGIVIEVRDTGIGIPEADLDKLFTRFYRASNATAAVLPGTGLGLAIVREIVERHGGAVEVDSTLGSGTTFTVWLPARVRPE